MYLLVDTLSPDSWNMASGLVVLKAYLDSCNHSTVQGRKVVSILQCSPEDLLYFAHIIHE